MCSDSLFPTRDLIQVKRNQAAVVMGTYNQNNDLGILLYNAIYTEEKGGNLPGDNSFGLREICSTANIPNASREELQSP